MTFLATLSELQEVLECKWIQDQKWYRFWWWIYWFLETLLDLIILIASATLTFFIPTFSFKKEEDQEQRIEKSLGVNLERQWTNWLAPIITVSKMCLMTSGIRSKTRRYCKAVCEMEEIWKELIRLRLLKNETKEIAEQLLELDSRLCQIATKGQVETETETR